MDWLTGWTYRKQIKLSRASGAVTDYQLKLLAGESSGATGADVHCGGKCLSSFDDLRFTNAAGTLLGYWIESITGTTPNRLAVVWIKFDSIAASDTAFYMYYGNSGAAAVSNGDDTFALFDDFLGNTLNSDKWQSSITESIENSILTINGRNGQSNIVLSNFMNNYTYGQGYALRARISTDHLGGTDGSENGGFGHKMNNRVLVSPQDDSSGTTGKYHCYAGSGVMGSGSIAGMTAGVYGIWDVMRCEEGNNKCIFRHNDANEVVITTNIPSDGLAIHFSAWNNVLSKVCVDWVAVRQFYETEPAWGAWGSEQDVNSVALTVGPLAAATSMAGAPNPLWTRLVLSPLNVSAGFAGTPRYNQIFKISPPPLEVSARLAGAAGYLFFVIPPELCIYAGLSSGNIFAFLNVDFLVIYICRLTPVAGSIYSEMTLPVSSFQGRFKSGDPSFLSVVIPGLDLSEDISSRVDTAHPPLLSIYMVKTYFDGNVIMEQLVAVNLEDIRIDEGAVNQTITLEGHKTRTHTHKSIALTGASYKSISGGKTRYRCEPDLFLRPGDTVTVNGETFIADNITIAISVDSQIMEISEK
jgi:hypothetical protein